MPRPILDESNIHPAIRERIASHEQAIVREVQAAVAQHPVVVVGMGMNPFPKKACKALDAAGLAYHYLEYGNRHRGQLIGCAPATPPGMRVRTGRFAKLRSCEFGDTKAVEMIHS